MGTRLIARGLDPSRDDPALWNLDHPEIVQQFHRRDIEAGADILITNTFGAHRSNLERLGRAADLAAIVRRAVALGRAAQRPGLPVFGSLGPLPRRRTWALDLDEAAFHLLEAGVDALLLETYQFPEALDALNRLAPRVETPLLVSLHLWPEPAAPSARRLADAGAAALGCNCQVGMEPMLRVAAQLRGATSLPLLIQPSAGRPGQALILPGTLALAVPELAAQGVRYLGGCCGTTEAHLAAFRQALDQGNLPASP
jgi:methionine synthase I (cobalamin-dependent)